MVSLGGFYTLKRHGEFQYVYNKAKSFHSNTVVLFYLQQAGIKKVGFTATKKIGNAVTRNRAKRRLRALFYQYSPHLKEGIYIFVSKLATVSDSHAKLDADFSKMLKISKTVLPKDDTKITA